MNIPHCQRAGLTKDGAPRKGKATHTARRYQFTIYFWRNLRKRLRHHCKLAKGNATRLALAIGSSPPQVHRWQCDSCEHDQEPSFSVGMALLLYLESFTLAQAHTRTITLAHNSPAISIQRKTKTKKK